MSQGVFGWRAKVTGLGLLLGVVVLSGATCLPPELDPAAGTINTGGQTFSMTLTVDAPLANINIAAGAVVQISWTAFNQGRPGKVTVFYNTSRSLAGVSNLTIVDLAAANPPSRYNWDTTGLAPGTYYVGATISDGTTTSAASWAVGTVTITSTALVQQLSLDQLGAAMKGCVFEGFSFAGGLGTTMAGRFDMLSDSGTPDGISDFILVATHADSHYSNDPEVGEAYLVLGWNGGAGLRSAAWYNGGRFSVNAVGTDPNLSGAIIVGPSYITSSLGVAAIQPLADADGDGGAELMFGMPLLVNGRFDDQDYDPCDCPLPPANVYSNAPFGRPNPSNPPTPDDHDFWGGLVNSGYITVLASTTPGLFNGASKLGGVVHIDEIGQTDGEHDTHPRTTDPATGLRIYPFARLPAAYDFLNNDDRYGAQIGTEDVDGDGLLDWMIASPKALGAAGAIDVHFASQALLWTGGLPTGAACYSWPYTISNGNPCPNCERILVWPIGTLDRIRGDEMKAPGGELGNPTGISDFNSDLLGDIACSTPKWSAGGLLPNAGAAYLIFGRAPFGSHDVGEIKDPVVLNALPGIAIEGTEPGAMFGQAMTGLGRPNRTMPGNPKLTDFNADGLPEWVISAPGHGIPGRDNAGAVAIIFGNSRLDGRFTWNQISTGDLPGLIITGANQGDAFGTYMAEAGDLNGDGSDDLLVAAPGAENPVTGAQDTGAIYIIYGPPASSAQLNQYQALSGTYNIADLIDNKGPIKVQVIYGSVAGHKIGPVAGAGDIDNDGFEDILIGDPLAAPLGRTDAGEVYLIFGGNY